MEFYAYDVWVPRIIGVKDWVKIDDTEQMEDKEMVDWNMGGKRARQCLKELGGDGE